jgi:hypothetical protein
MLARLRPRPDLVLFPGDHIDGTCREPTSTLAQSLRGQWLHWKDEAHWLHEAHVPHYGATSNHNTTSAEHERVWRETWADLPRNGPLFQDGLSYYVRRGDLLIIAVNTNYSGLGGAGHVEWGWLDQVLTAHEDAPYKLVMGHHPVFAVNGYGLSPQWCIVPHEGHALWGVLVRHGVLAYLCSHVIAFDVQVHAGVLQILTGGAGTNYGPGGYMPGLTEYLHAVQIAVDSGGLRYQVLDLDGAAREALSWPPRLPRSDGWPVLHDGLGEPMLATWPGSPTESCLLAWRLAGELGAPGGEQTLLCAYGGTDPVALWIGLVGLEARLCVRLVAVEGEGPQTWWGPELVPGGNPALQVQVALHTGMGPGGVLYRWSDGEPWHSLETLSCRGAEGTAWLARRDAGGQAATVTWAVGHGQSGPDDRPFRGDRLVVHACAAFQRLG